MEHFADRLLTEIARKQVAACVGFDPVWDRLPAEILKAHGLDDDRNGAYQSLEARAAAIRQFGVELFDVVAPLVPAVKINIAFFEPLQEAGWRVYHELVASAQARGLIVIGDAKRGDIGSTSAQYAMAHLARRQDDVVAVADAVTVNPYFGHEGVGPFVETARAAGRGIFVLVQTSNPSAMEVQGLVTADGLTVCQKVAQLVESWAATDGALGSTGYSCVGAVVSPRDLDSTRLIRRLMPSCLFLVPGFGAQGRTADEVALCFKPDGTGALVTASRSVIFAFREPDYQRRFQADWRRSVEAACADFVAQIQVVSSPHRSGRTA